MSIVDFVERNIKADYKGGGGVPNSYVRLQENDPSAYCTYVEIRSRNKYAVINPDKIKNYHLYNFFKNRQNINTVCDFIIFSEGEFDRIFLVNLKSSGRKSCAEQLLAGELLAEIIYRTYLRLMKRSIDEFVDINKVVFCTNPKILKSYTSKSATEWIEFECHKRYELELII